MQVYYIAYNAAGECEDIHAHHTKPWAWTCYPDWILICWRNKMRQTAFKHWRLAPMEALGRSLCLIEGTLNCMPNDIYIRLSIISVRLFVAHYLYFDMDLGLSPMESPTETPWVSIRCVATNWSRCASPDKWQLLRTPLHNHSPLPIQFKIDVPATRNIYIAYMVVHLATIATDHWLRIITCMWIL